MVALQHVYLTAHGEWNTAPWTEERAQIGLRLAITHGLAQPAKGAPFDILTTNGDIDYEASTTAGTNGTLSQTWTARLGPAPSSQDANAAWQVGIAEDMRAFLWANRGQQTSAFQWTHIKIAPIDSLGHYGEPGSSTYDLTAPIVGGSSSDALPPQVAMVISLRAPISGRRGRGRVYIPGLTEAALDADGTIADTTRTPWAASMVTLIDALEDDPGLDVYAPTVMVTSAGRSTGVRPSEVRIGDHWDVQRRRQDQAVEDFLTTAL